jgi:hypothetical protein
MPNLTKTAKQILKQTVNPTTYDAIYNFNRSLKKLNLYVASSVLAGSKQSIHFIHIGKTGGSSVRYALSNPSCEQRYKFFFHNHDVRLEDIPREQKVFFFLRDPCTRFVSGFYSRQRMGKPKYYQPWTSGEALAFSKFDTPNALAESLSSEDNALRQAAFEAMSNIMHVKDSYLYWFKSQEYFLSRLSDILFVGFQESLETDFLKFKEKLGLTSEVFLPSNKNVAHKTPSSLDKNLSSEAKKNLMEWYAQDYIFLKLVKNLSNI